MSPETFCNADLCSGGDELQSSVQVFVTRCVLLHPGDRLDREPRRSVPQQTHRRGEVPPQSPGPAEKTRRLWRCGSGECQRNNRFDHFHVCFYRTFRRFAARTSAANLPGLMPNFKNHRVWWWQEALRRASAQPYTVTSLSWMISEYRSWIWGILRRNITWETNMQRPGTSLWSLSKKLVSAPPRKRFVFQTAACRFSWSFQGLLSGWFLLIEPVSLPERICLNVNKTCLACFCERLGFQMAWNRSAAKPRAAERQLKSHFSRTFCFHKRRSYFSSIDANYFANSSLKAKSSSDRTTSRHGMSFGRHDNLLWWMCGPV